ncbi:unnamed protein product [Protopolystoma xenopodis]|uniref:Uncharacterized protein n=1 Tax=Protopolystoma xenopodis TaxID=117903 RepID=A0A3S5FCK5_9PLAT|nr:unnamed protein product [Protopolystoma xenopodis]
MELFSHSCLSTPKKDPPITPHYPRMSKRYHQSWALEASLDVGLWYHLADGKLNQSGGRELVAFNVQLRAVPTKLLMPFLSSQANDGPSSA